MVDISFRADGNGNCGVWLKLVQTDLDDMILYGNLRKALKSDIFKLYIILLLFISKNNYPVISNCLLNIEAANALL